MLRTTFVIVIVTQGVPFTDYSNLVGSPNGTSCTVPVTTPEVPATLLIVVVGGAAVGGFLYTRRRRAHTVSLN